MATARIAAALVVVTAFAFANGALAAPPAPPLITNGDFESSTLPPWAHTSGVVQLADDTWWTAASGSQSVELGAYGSMYQDVATTAGTRYDLTFAYAGNPGCAQQGVKHLTVAWNGTLAGWRAGTATFSFDTTGHSAADMGWQTAHVLVDAASATTRLTFSDDRDLDCGITVDKVAMVPASGTQTGTQLTSALTSTPVGEPFTVTATVLGASSASTPTGSVQFLIDGVPEGGPVPLSSGRAELTLSDLTPGVYDYTAVYTPDSSSFSGSEATQRFGPAKGASGTTLGIDSSPSTVGQEVTLTATINVLSGIAEPTGTVQFRDSYGPFGDPVPVASDGTAAIVIQPDAGTYYLWADYSGDDNLIPSTGYGELTVEEPPPPATVAKLATTVTMTSSRNPAPPGETYKVTATVAPSAPSDLPLDGTVTFSINSVQFGDPIPLDAARSASVTLTAPSGLTSQPIRAQYNGNSSFLRSNGRLTQRFVTAAATPPPPIPELICKIAPRATKLGRLIKRGATVDINCNHGAGGQLVFKIGPAQARRLGFKATRPMAIARGKLAIGSSAQFSMRAAVPKKYRKRLAAAKRLALTITFAGIDAPKKTTSVTRRVTLKR